MLINAWFHACNFYLYLSWSCKTLTFFFGILETLSRSETTPFSAGLCDITDPEQGRIIQPSHLHLHPSSHYAAFIKPLKRLAWRYNVVLKIGTPWWGRETDSTKTSCHGDTCKDRKRTLFLSHFCVILVTFDLDLRRVIKLLYIYKKKVTICLCRRVETSRPSHFSARLSLKYMRSCPAAGAETGSHVIQCW